ncbi:MAG TPA: hypothetical protein VJ852_02600 [Gemmatimonadaceae bacterium]|nr:hypothetical protein [Gemmatimonadaceae bacterium]
MRVAAVLVVLGAGIVGCSNTDADKTAGSDSAFARLQQRGAAVMGVDQYTSQHVFEPLPDGGRIVLQRKEADSAGEQVIREHMYKIAQAFAAGDFTLPGVVHAMKDVPGTQQMREMRDEITYTPQDLPGGGEVVISTRNPKAVAAIHDFLAFQRMDHRAGAHME